MFTAQFNKYACDGDSITCEVDGFTITATIHRDDCGDVPWDREDGHGTVTHWTHHAKRPGQLVLSSDRHSMHRYYDFQEACKIARRDGWRAPGDHDKPMSREVAARAARHDFEVLKAWCEDRWWYVGVAVTVEKDDIELTGTYDHALWGVECNYPGSDNSYLQQVANELLPDALESAKAVVASLAA